jgi:hypothetical protein
VRRGGYAEFIIIALLLAGLIALFFVSCVNFRGIGDELNITLNNRKTVSGYRVRCDECRDGAIRLQTADGIRDIPGDSIKSVKVTEEKKTLPGALRRLPPYSVLSVKRLSADDALIGYYEGFSGGDMYVKVKEEIVKIALSDVHTIQIIRKARREGEMSTSDAIIMGAVVYSVLRSGSRGRR